MYNCHLGLGCIVWGTDILNLKISKNYTVVCVLIIYAAEMPLNTRSIRMISGFHLAVHEIWYSKTCLKRTPYISETWKNGK